MSADFSDVIIQIEDEKIYAHKNILTRNEVFEKMLISKMMESKNNILIISDCDVKTFKVYLKYLYTSEVDDDEIMENLLILANKFLEKQLKWICKCTILAKLQSILEDDNLLPQTLIHTLLFAVKYNCIMLKQEVVNLIAKYFKKVKKHSEFESLFSDKETVLLIMKSLNQINEGNISFHVTSNGTALKKDINSNFILVLIPFIDQLFY